MNNNKCTLISFIIPAFNCETYLFECIKSIIMQQLASFEIIIINDGSTDNTLSIAESIKQNFPSKIKLYSKKNGGAASARNYGLRNCSGKYVIFVDSDDLIFGDDLRECVKQMENNKIDVLISNISLLDKGQIKRNEYNYKSVLVTSDVLKYVSYLPKFPGSCCSKIFSRHFLEKNNLYFEEGIINEDINYMINCFSNNPALYHNDKSWYLYRQNVINSVTNTIQPKNCIDMFEIIKNQLKVNKNKEICRILCYEYSTLFYHYNRLDKEDKKKLVKYFSTYKFLLKERFLREKIIYYLYCLFGLKRTAFLISAVYKLKKLK